MVLSGCVSPTLQFEEVQELLVAFLLPALLSETGGLRAISSRQRPGASCRQKKKRGGGGPIRAYLYMKKRERAVFCHRRH